MAFLGSADPGVDELARLRAEIALSEERYARYEAVFDQSYRDEPMTAPHHGQWRLSSFGYKFNLSFRATPRQGETPSSRAYPRRVVCNDVDLYASYYPLHKGWRGEVGYAPESQADRLMAWGLFGGSIESLLSEPGLKLIQRKPVPILELQDPPETGETRYTFTLDPAQSYRVAEEEVVVGSHEARYIVTSFSRIRGASVPQTILIQQRDGAGEMASYGQMDLVYAKFGDEADMFPAESMGPFGALMRDWRYGDRLWAYYRRGKQLPTPPELRNLVARRKASTSPMPPEPQR